MDAFTRDFPDLAPRLPVEVASLVSSDLDEDRLEAKLVAMGCQLIPPDGGTYRGWLTQIADRVRAAIG